MVKISIVFLGRQMAHQEFGPRLLEKIMTSLDGIALQEREARFEGRRYVTIVKPTKRKVPDVSKVSEVSEVPQAKK